MKKKLLSLLLALVMCLGLAAPAMAATTRTEITADEVLARISVATNRRELAALILALINEYCDPDKLPAVVTSPSPFTDCNDPAVVTLYNWQVMQGISPTTFGPEEAVGGAFDPRWGIQSKVAGFINQYLKPDVQAEEPAAGDKLLTASDIVITATNRLELAQQGYAIITSYCDASVLPTPAEASFPDCDDPAVLALAGWGLVRGRQDGKYEPDGPIEPQALTYFKEAVAEFINKYLSLTGETAGGGDTTPETEAPSEPTTTTTGTAYQNSVTVLVDGKEVVFPMYSSTANRSSNYIRIRDLAYILKGTDAEFGITWTQAAGTALQSHTEYLVPENYDTTMAVPFSGDQPYVDPGKPIPVDGVDTTLECLALQNGAYTYYKLRDLGIALDFNVGWDREKGLFVETDKPYDPSN